MFRAATLSKMSFIEEVVTCWLRVLVNAGHSIRKCLTVSGQWQAEQCYALKTVMHVIPYHSVYLLLLSVQLSTGVCSMPGTLYWVSLVQCIACTVIPHTCLLHVFNKVWVLRTSIGNRYSCTRCLVLLYTHLYSPAENKKSKRLNK